MPVVDDGKQKLSKLPPDLESLKILLIVVIEHMVMDKMHARARLLHLFISFPINI